jgi:hypothetical protein
MEGIMFEAGQDEKQDTATKMWIGIFVIVAVAALGALYYYTTSKGTANGPEPAAAPAAAAEAPSDSGKSDPLHDLKVQRATMEKDRTGTTAIWSVTIENRSAAYAYSDILYETTYIGADNKVLLVNKGRIASSIGPGQQASPEIRDALYPVGTVLYKFKITDAKASQ